MRLDADPTLVYALGDFTITRVLNIHKTIDSPYNTYLYAGLPPGPICLQHPPLLTRSLNYQAHNYWPYFCARDDFSGYHAFAATYVQHLVNARRFQRRWIGEVSVTDHEIHHCFWSSCCWVFSKLAARETPVLLFVSKADQPDSLGFNLVEQLPALIEPRIREER